MLVCHAFLNQRCETFHPKQVLCCHDCVNHAHCEDKCLNNPDVCGQMTVERATSRKTQYKSTEEAL
jgi:hypothetical protein